jgi:glycosyltransferase involved in cell wall biosynthesis
MQFPSSSKNSPTTGMSRLRIAFYDDAAMFGGHEAMLVRILASLAQTPEVKVILVHSRNNATLKERALEAHPRLECYSLPFSTQSLDNITPPFRLNRLISTWTLLRRLSLDRLVVVQGRIELCLTGLLAAKLLRLPTVSYIPFAHPLASLSVRMHRLRDLLNRFYYCLPDRYITISSSAATTLRKLSGRPVDILPNNVSQNTPMFGRQAARGRLSLPGDIFLLAVVGRMESRQKGQDIAIRAVRRLTLEGRNIQLLIVGDGKDHRMLMEMVANNNLGTSVTFRPWIPEVGLIYAAADIVLIPSRFEGVPLVMIEAILANVPVVASAVDGLLDYLPAKWLVPADDEVALAKKIIELQDNPPAATELADVKCRLIADLSTQRFDRLVLDYFATSTQKGSGCSHD